MKKVIALRHEYLSAVFAFPKTNSFVDFLLCDLGWSVYMHAPKGVEWRPA